jgi:hypothetical protein
MKNFKEFLNEEFKSRRTLVMDKPVHTKTITSDELLKHIGRSKIRSMAKHPFHREYFNNVSHARYQYHRDSNGHEHVLAAPVDPQ